MRMSANPQAPNLACVYSTSHLVIVVSEVCGYLISWYVWWWPCFHQLSVVLWSLERGRAAVCTCVGSSYLPNRLTWWILLISSFQPLPISISLPIRESPKMFQCRLNLSLITESLKKATKKWPWLSTKRKWIWLWDLEVGAMAFTSRSSSPSDITHSLKESWLDWQRWWGAETCSEQECKSPKAKRESKHSLKAQSSGHWRGQDVLRWRQRQVSENSYGSLTNLLLQCSMSPPKLGGLMFSFLEAT